MTEFEVLGPPVSKQRPRKGPNGWYTPRKTKDFEELVGWSAKAAGLSLEPKKPYGVEIEFYLSTHRRDLDNLAKTVLDGLNGIGGWDDCQVVNLHVKSVDVTDGSEEKTVVRVRER